MSAEKLLGKLTLFCIPPLENALVLKTKATNGSILPDLLDTYWIGNTNNWAYFIIGCSLHTSFLTINSFCNTIAVLPLPSSGFFGGGLSSVTA